MNVFFQKIIGEEVKEQLNNIGNAGMHSLQKINPDYLVACVGGGSNAQGLFYEFLDEKNVKLI
jgi:tryptophan synthase beta subunit